MKTGVIEHGGELIYYEVTDDEKVRATVVGDGPAERTESLLQAIAADLERQEKKKNA